MGLQAPRSPCSQEGWACTDFQPPPLPQHYMGGISTFQLQEHCLHGRVSDPASLQYECRISFSFAACREITLFLELNANASCPSGGEPALRETSTRRKQPCEGLLGPTWVQGGFAGCALRGSTVWCCDSSNSSWAAPSV